MNRKYRIIIFSISVIIVFICWRFRYPKQNPKPKTSAKTYSANAAQVDSDDCFLAISDIHLHDGFPQYLIDTSVSDLGNDFWDTAKEKIKNVLLGNRNAFKKPKFIIYLGDLPWHASRDSLNSAMKSAGIVLKDLRELAEGANIPLMYVPGNNDSHEEDYGDFSMEIFSRDLNGKSRWPMVHEKSDRPNSGTSTLISSPAFEMEKIGCYSAYPLGKSSKLRIIVMNTTIFTMNYKNKTNPKAFADSQFVWLRDQLKETAQSNEKTLIVMHVPPGLDGFKILQGANQRNFWNPALIPDTATILNLFLNLVDKYQNNIIGILSSHTHMDGIRKLYNSSAQFTNLVISIPSISFGHGNNPALKIITYNPKNFDLNNFITMYTVFNNSSKQTEIKTWGDSCYEFNKEFGNLSGMSMRDWIAQLDSSKLKESVRKIYKVKNGEGNSIEVDEPINVRRQ